MNTKIKKILYINPDASDKLNKMHKAYVDNHIAQGYAADVVNIPYGAELVNSNYYASVNTPYIVDEVLKGESKGYDAAIISCFANPGVKEAREVVDIPVVVPGEASLYLAMQLGDRISILTVGAAISHKNMQFGGKFHHKFSTSIRREIQLTGLLHRIASIRTIGVSSGSKGISHYAEKDPAQDIDPLTEQGKCAIEKDGAEVIILGCTNMMGVADSLQDRLGVPVVDSVVASLRLAETLISMNLSHSRLTYPFENADSDKVPIQYPPTLKGYHGYHP